MKILLINPISRRRYDNLRFPLGLSYISETLINSGHQVEILDLAVIEWNMRWLEAGISSGRYRDIDAVGVTGLISEYKNIKGISTLFKKYHPDKPIVLGGAFATSMPQELLEKTDVDIIVAREGEATARELFEKLESGEDIFDVRGIFFKKNGQVIFTGQRDDFSDLDAIGFPSRKGFNIEAYFYNSPLAMFASRRTLNMITSRGCPYSCFYCDKRMWGSKCRIRTPKNIVEEIIYLINTFRIDSIVFHDDTFNIDAGRVTEFCNLLMDNHIRINWLANCRVNNITLELSKTMRKAGCRMVAYGIESGSQAVLDSMKKGVRLEKAAEAIKATWRAGIIPFGYLMIGWFDETKRQVIDTINFCIKNKLMGDFSFFTPAPYTPAFFKARENTKIPLDTEVILSKWGEWHSRKMVNVSSLADEELIFLKKYAEKRILRANLSGAVFLYIRAMGIVYFLREIIRRIFRYGIKGFRARCE